MSQLIERVAKALYEVRPEMEWGEATPWADLGEPQGPLPGAGVSRHRRSYKGLG